MVLYYHITIDDSRFRSIVKKLQGPAVMEECTKANFKTGQILADRMRNFWVGNDRNGERLKHSGGFKAIMRKGTYTVDITVPKPAYWMDVMKMPRYFSINGKPRMRSWINRNWGKAIQSGKSRLHFKGKFVKYGSLYVYPDHFSNRAILSIRKEHQYYLGKVIKNVVKGGI